MKWCGTDAAGGLPPQQAANDRLREPDGWIRPVATTGLRDAQPKKRRS